MLEFRTNIDIPHVLRIEKPKHHLSFINWDEPIKMPMFEYEEFERFEIYIGALRDEYKEELLPRVSRSRPWPKPPSYLKTITSIQLKAAGDDRFGEFIYNTDLECIQKWDGSSYITIMENKMKVNIENCIRVMEVKSNSTGNKFCCEELVKHLKELREKTEKGDFSVLEEFFNLYSFSDNRNLFTSPYKLPGTKKCKDPRFCEICHTLARCYFVGDIRVCDECMEKCVNNYKKSNIV